MGRILLTAMIAAGLSACNSGGGTDPEPAATTISITPNGAELEAGGETVSLEAEVRDQHGETMPGATVSWSSDAPSVASVNSGTGVVTSGSAGNATITATSGAASGSIQIAVTALPVASVEFSGPTRVKARSTTPTYSVEARLADGSEVERPVSWEVEGIGASIAEDGSLTTTEAGQVRVSATVDGKVWEGPTVTVYDWTYLSGDDVQVAYLPSHLPQTNQRDVTAYPELLVGCRPSDSFFVVWVDTVEFITASGHVRYSFDGSDLVQSTWHEISDFRVLAHSGDAAARKGFASTAAGAEDMFFIFDEYLGDTQYVLFQPEGLQEHLEPLLEACPVDYLAPPAAAPAPRELIEKVHRIRGRATPTPAPRLP